MKNNFALFLFCTCLISPVIASHKMHLSGRIDYRSIDNDTKATGVPNNLGFNLASTRIGFSGNISNELSYGMELETAGDKSSVDKVTNDSGIVNSIYLSHKLTDNLSATFGKHYNAHGGYEYNSNPQNVYLYSLVGNNLSYWVYGGSLTYKLMNHSFKFIVANADRSTDNSSNANQNSLSYGVNWYGSFGEIFKPTLGYNVKPKRSNKEEVAITSAVKFDFNMWNAELEYYQLELDNETTNGKTDKMTSLIAKLEYKSPKFAPFIKFIMDENEVSDSKTFEQTSYVVALNYHPFEDDFRYHIAYTQTNKDFVGATMDSDISTIYAGVRFNFDVFKL